MNLKKYRVPLTADATASATFFVEANDAREAIVVARGHLMHRGRVLLALDVPNESALRHADVLPPQEVTELTVTDFEGEPTPESADVESELTPVELERYLLADGGVCPFCSAWEIEGGSIDIESGNAYQEITCARCDGNWVDRYRLAPEGPYHVHRPTRAVIEAARDGETATA